MDDSLVTQKKRSKVRIRSRDRPKQSNTNDDRNNEGEKDGSFQLPLVSGIAGADDGNELKSAEHSVHERDGGLLDRKTRKDEGTKDVCYRCADVECQRHSDPNVHLGLEHCFPHLLPLEILRSDTCLVRFEHLKSLEFVLLTQKPCGGNVVIKLPPDQNRREDGNDTADHEDVLPTEKRAAFDLTETV